MVAELKKYELKRICLPMLFRYVPMDMIKTVIRNLLSNAVKFSHEGSEVVISLRKEGEMAVVSVEDRGCGIDEENQKRQIPALISLPSARIK